MRIVKHLANQTDSHILSGPFFSFTLCLYSVSFGFILWLIPKGSIGWQMPFALTLGESCMFGAPSECDYPAQMIYYKNSCCTANHKYLVLLVVKMVAFSVPLVSLLLSLPLCLLLVSVQSAVCILCFCSCWCVLLAQRRKVKGVA